MLHQNDDMVVGDMAEVVPPSTGPQGMQRLYKNTLHNLWQHLCSRALSKMYVYSHPVMWLKFLLCTSLHNQLACMSTKRLSTLMQLLDLWIESLL